MKRTILLLFIAVFCAKGVSFAETEIKAELDKHKVTTDEALTLKITLSSDEKSLPQPEFPDFADFQVLSSAQSSNISLSSSGLKTALTFVFILLPERTGVLKIAPASIRIAEQTYSTETIEVEVKKGRLRPKSTPLPRRKIPRADTPKVTL